MTDSYATYLWTLTVCGPILITCLYDDNWPIGWKVVHQKFSIRCLLLEGARQSIYNNIRRRV